MGFILSPPPSKKKKEEERITSFILHIVFNQEGGVMEEKEMFCYIIPLYPPKQLDINFFCNSQDVQSHSKGICTGSNVGVIFFSVYVS